MKRPPAHTPPKSFHDILLPCCGAIPKKDKISQGRKIKLTVLELDEEVYDFWYLNLPPKLKKAEYENFLRSRLSTYNPTTRLKLMEEKAERLKYILKIEKLKLEGKLRADYIVK